MNDTTFIYALLEPETGKIRYLGKSINPKARFRNHTKPVIPPKTYKERWISGLRDIGLAPLLEILDEVPTLEASFWEREYIQVFRSIGMALTNTTEGGEGWSIGNTIRRGVKCSDKTRSQMSLSRTGKKDSPETKIKKRIALRGNTNSLGYKHTEESKKLMREARMRMPGPTLGMVFPEEWRKNMALAKVGTKHPGASSKFLGVGWRKKEQKWLARFSFGGRSKCLGLYLSEKEAALAYDREARRVLGPLAKVNFP